MASIAQTQINQQEGHRAHHVNLNEQDSYRLVVRFGKDLLSDGFTAIPNLLLDLYAELGITHCELVFLLHLLQYKWSRAEPYPSLGTIATKMGLSIRAVQNHVQSLRHKALHCSHTDEENCSCPRYLTVTPRYQVGIGQTSNSYNLSGLFAAVLNLAREKGLLPQADPVEKCTGPHAGTCMGGMKEPAYESDVSKNTQVESNESFSKLRGGMAESTPTSSHGEHGTLRQPEEKTEEPTEQAPSTPSSREQTNTHRADSPSSSPPRAESSKTETPRSREMGRPQQSLSGKDEVKWERREQHRASRERTRPESPRMTAPPLTQEDMDKRIRERLARERARTQMQNPLPGIIRDEDWNKLEQDAPTAPPQTKGKPMPVSPRLQQSLEHISEEFGDSTHMKSNITQADNIRRQAKVSIEQVLDVLPEAYHATRVAVQSGKITKRDQAGRLVKMPYFFAVVRQKLGLPPKEGQAV